MLYCSTLGGMMDMIGKNICRILAVLIAVVFLLPAGMIGSMNFETEAAEEASPGLDMRVMVNGYSFDPLKEEPNILPEMKLSSPNGYFIVQMNGPILQEWREEIEEAGAFIHSYIPNFAYLVFMGNAERAKVESLPYVRWVGNFEPAYKIGVKDVTGNVKLNIVLFEEQKNDNIGWWVCKTKINGDIVGGRHTSDTVLKEEEEIISPRVGDFDAMDWSRMSPEMKNNIRKLKMDTENRLREYQEMGYIIPGFNDRFSERMTDRRNGIVASRIESIGGRIVEWNEENRIVVEIDSSKISSLAFTPNILYIEQWYPKEQLMDIISLYGDTTANGYMYIDYAQAAGFDGSKWAARFPGKIIGAHEEPDTGSPIEPGGARLSHQGFGGRVSLIAGTNDPTCWHGQACLGIEFWGSGMAPGAGVVPNGYGGIVGGGVTDANAATAVLNNGGYTLSHSYFTGTNTGAYTTTSAGIDSLLINTVTHANMRKLVFTWGAGNLEQATGDNPTQESTAKNVICVGGVEHQNTANPSDDIWGTTGVSYGCKGPADDGRQKPDLCGPCENILTLGETSDTATTTFGGTSGANPVVAGCAMLIQEMYVEDYWTVGNTVPYAATVKAILIANAEQYALGTISRDKQGWGYPNMKNVVGKPHEIVSDEDYSLSTSDTQSFVISAAGGYPLHITLVWRDPAGTGAADGDTAPDLVNNLDLKVTSVSTGTVYYGNMGMKLNQNTVASTGTNPWSGGTSSSDLNVDDLNNVENVFIASPSGDYTVEVKGQNVPSGPQAYSLIASGAAPKIGKIKTDKSMYNFGDQIEITAIDNGLNPSTIVADTWPDRVHVSSTLDTVGFNVTITETGLDTNVFTANVAFSKDEPVGVNYRQSYPTASPPVLGVNPEDTITLKYHDADPEQYITITKPFDEVAPKITNVTVTNLMYSEFTVEFDTDEPCLASVTLPTVDSKMTDHDLMNNMWEQFDAAPATITDIRNGNDSGIWNAYYDDVTGDDTTYTTHHKISFSRNWDNMTYLFYIQAKDKFGNVAYDTNTGEYYSVKTPKQPFDILIVNDDVYIDGAYYDWLGVWYAGYYPLMTYGIGGGPTSAFFTDWGLDWNASWKFTNYNNHFDNTTLATNQEYWDAMIAASATGVDNIVIWNTGDMCVELAAYKPAAPSKGYKAFDWWSVDSYTVNATAQGLLGTFLDTKKGNVVYHGMGWWEDARDRAEILTFMHNYMHADKVASYAGSTVAGKAQGYDVAAATYAHDGTDITGVYDSDYAYVNMTKTAGAVVMTEGCSIDMSRSADEIDGSAYGGTNELAWGKNYKDESPSIYYSAVSYAGTDEKTFYASGGDPGDWIGMSAYIYSYEPLKTYWTNIINWMAPNDCVGSTGVSGTVTGVEGAVVQAFAVGDRTNVLGGAITDASGNYQINITAGTYDMIAFAKGYTTDNTSRTGANAVTVSTGAIATLKDFTISTAVGGIEGTVLVYDPVWKEMKLGGIRVKAESASLSVVKEVFTDNGYYCIDDLPVASDYVVTAYDLVYVNAGYTYSGIETKSETGVTVSTGTYITKDFTLRTGRISGLVLDIDYKPIENAFVYVVESDKTLDQDYKANCSTVLSWAETDERGHYYIPFIGNNTIGYTLRAEADGEYVFYTYNSTTDTSKYVDEAYGYFNETYSEGTPTTVYVSWGLETPSINFTLAKSTGTLTGYVYLPGGVTPAVGAKVSATVQIPSTALGPSWGYWKTDSYGSVEWPGISMIRSYGWDTAVWYTYAGIDGSYTIPAVVAATYNVSAIKSGYASGYQNSQVVTALATTTVPDIVLGTISGCSILYVDDDGGSATQDANTLAAIQANTPNTISGNTTSVSYTEWDVAAKGSYPTASYMKGFTFVIWTTGGYYTGAAHGNAEAVLMEFLDDGGSIFMTSQDWEYDHGLSTFLTDYCRLAGVGQDKLVGTTVTGVAADPISGSYATTALPTGATPFTDYADWLTPAADGITVFKDGTSTNINAVRYVGAYKTYYSGFPFEFVTTGAGANGYMGHIIDWVSQPPNYGPILSNGYVSPTTGTTGTSFTFYVDYTDIENDAPAYVNVTVDGTMYSMVKTIVDNTYDNGCQYKYAFGTFSTMGAHTFSFSAAGGGANAVGDTWNHTGPTITDTTNPIITITQGLFGVNTNEVAQANATITDNLKIDSATLWWRMNTSAKAVGPWQSRDMTLSGSQLDP
ncbi:MAG: hypothetical protein L6265_02595, partial [Thermoplasmatales archaeon]|nr:hypothetical protein [Thermoplasmatales archaeon]